MKEEADTANYFTSSMIDKIARIWARSTISLLDVRHMGIYPNDPLQSYRMPGSGLVYACGVQATVQLNRTVFGMERFGIFHGGKGTTLSIAPVEARLDVYMVLYKAENPPFYKKEVLRLLEQINPFAQHYGYSPANPIWFVDMFRKMLERWNRATALSQFQAKNILFQLVHEIYSDLEREGAKFLQPDPVVAAKRYLDEHYKEPVMFQEMADMFAISGGQLTRLFKKREGTSLQQYLIRKRLEAARHCLLHTEATVKEIAAGCGFVDEINLFRMFKKHYKMAPGDYRKINTWSMQVREIDNVSQSKYNGEGLDNLAQYTGDGELSMIGQSKGKEMIVVAAMSLMLLLSACSSNAPANMGGAASSAPVQTGQAQATPEAGTNAQAEAGTRIVQTVLGDIEVSLHPKRVVAESYWVGDIVALGNVPAAVQRFYTGQELYSDQLSNTAFIDSWEPEDIMSYDPDLIITRYEEDFEKLSKIAPTVVVPWDMPDAERLPLLAQVLGKEARDGTEVVEAYEQVIREGREKLADAGVLDKTISIMHDMNNGNMMIHLKAWAGGTIYEDLGMKMPDKVRQLSEQNPEYGGIDVSFEVLPQYVDELLLLIDHGSYGELKDNDVWKAIPAVADNRLVVINNEHLFFTDMMTKTAKLNKIVDHLLALGQNEQ